MSTAIFGNLSSRLASSTTFHSRLPRCAPRKAAIRGHGGSGTKLPLTWHLLIKALREDKMPYFDVYDSVTSSIIFPLSNQSVAGRSKTVDIPDFTKGKWKNRSSLSFKA